MIITNYIDKSIADGKLVGIGDKKVLGIYIIVAILFALAFLLAINNSKEKEEIITTLSIMAFILFGFCHCIADFPFLISNFSYINLFKFIVIILGNSLGVIYLFWKSDG